MARNTRQQRRARRRENAAAAASSAAPEQAQAPESAQPARPAPQRTRERPPRDARPERAPKPQAQREPRRRGSFVRESWAELNKVEWPGRGQVIAGTVAVIIACVIVGAYLWLADMAIQRIVERVLI